MMIQFLGLCAPQEDWFCVCRFGFVFFIVPTLFWNFVKQVFRAKTGEGGGGGEHEYSKDNTAASSITSYESIIKCCNYLGEKKTKTNKPGTVSLTLTCAETKN